MANHGKAKLVGPTDRVYVMPVKYNCQHSTTEVTLSMVDPYPKLTQCSLTLCESLFQTTFWSIKPQLTARAENFLCPEPNLYRQTKRSSITEGPCDMLSLLYHLKSCQLQYNCTYDCIQQGLQKVSGLEGYSLLSEWCYSQAICHLLITRGLYKQHLYITLFPRYDNVYSICSCLWPWP